MRIKARLAPLHLFNRILKEILKEGGVNYFPINYTDFLLFQHLLGPIVDLELLNSSDVVPRGVTVAVKHFLQVPKSSEEEEAMDGEMDREMEGKVSEVEKEVTGNRG